MADTDANAPAVITAAEHDRRVTELLNYSTDQVFRRRELAQAIRTVLARGAIDETDRAVLETALAENGGR